MKQVNTNMKSQDILLLLKLVSIKDSTWNQKPIAKEVGLSQSEVSEAVARCKYAGLLDPTGKTVMKLALFEFLQYGLKYVFPQKPGSVVRGVPTAHSANPLKEQIQSTEDYVWPYGRGKVRGQSIQPLYKSVPEIVSDDPKLYELLSLVDALRVGRAREKELAIVELKFRFGFGE